MAKGQLETEIGDTENRSVYTFPSTSNKSNGQLAITARHKTIETNTIELKEI